MLAGKIVSMSIENEDNKGDKQYIVKDNKSFASMRMTASELSLRLFCLSPSAF